MAQDTLRAAAVVNDEVISMLDLSMRTRFAMVSAGMEVTKENYERLQPQILRQLIDERIQSQEAERLDITATEEEVNEAFLQIAEQNRMTPQAFSDFMQRNGLLPTALRDQIRASLLWQKVVARRLRPEVEVSDEEVDRALNRMRNDAGGEEMRVGEIFLAVDNVLQEEEVMATAQRLIEQIKNGARFPALARQFSQSATASVGGDLGWISPAQLPEEVARALNQMSPGQLSPPISTFGGIYIVALVDRRSGGGGEATFDLKQVLFPVPEGAGNEALQAAAQQAQQVRGRIQNCVDAETISQEVSGRSADLGEVKVSDLPGKLRDMLNALPMGKPSEPVRLSGGVGVLVVCGKDDGTIDRDEIYETLVQERLDLLSRRYLRDLKRASNVDIRV